MAQFEIYVDLDPVSLAREGYWHPRDIDTLCDLFGLDERTRRALKMETNYAVYGIVMIARPARGRPIRPTRNVARDADDGTIELREGDE